MGFLVNRRFAEWFEKYGKESSRDRNDHGLWNGNNIEGVDPVPLFKASAEGKPLTIRQIFVREKALFMVRVPANRDFFDWQKRFPFQVEGGVVGPMPASWDITCNAIGMPLQFKRSSVRVSEPEVIWFDFNRPVGKSFSRGLVRRSGKQASLTERGKKWFSLLVYEGRLANSR